MSMNTMVLMDLKGSYKLSIRIIFLLFYIFSFHISTQVLIHLHIVYNFWENLFSLPFVRPAIYNNIHIQLMIHKIHLYS